MNNFYKGLCVVLVGMALLGCQTKQAAVDGTYKRYCLSRLDDAVDQCKTCAVGSMDSCYKSIFSIDTVRDINKDIWRGYAHAKGLFHHGFFKESRQMMNELVRDTGDPSLLLEHARLLQLRGDMEVIENQQTAAARDYYKSINIYVQLACPKDVAICYAAVANIQYNGANYKLAIENGHRSLAQSAVTRDDSMRYINVYNTMALSFVRLHNIDSGMYYFKTAENIAVHTEAEFWIGLVNGNMSTIMIQQGRLKEALENLTVDMRVSKKYKEYGSVAAAMLSKGDIYTKLGNIKAARLYYDSAYQMSETIANEKELLAVYFKKMAQFNRSQKKYKNADLYFQRYISLRDSLKGVNVGKNLEQIQNKSYMEKQLADINLLKMQNSYKTKELQLWQLCIGTIACALVLLVVLYRNKRVHNNQLKSLNSELEQKVKDRTLELTRTNEELDTYLYRASHDVRRPILSIIGLAQISAFAASADEQADIQQKIISTAQEMDKMLNKLKMTYELRAPIDTETFDLYLYITELAHTIGSFYPQASFTISKQGEAMLASDIRFITMVFLNILENACVFSHQHPQVHIDIRGEETTLQVSVTDKGIGIQKEYQSRIFEAYTRFSERSVGSGIGLYIVSRALTKVGGRISVQSTANEGSSFIVQLPRRV
ncbi:MAG TPA: ATP-binding protein [Ohtaekwangia sp.]|uniref:ATP-binding protein n=1 Tax=Ohtaekwangia sp. TaxID=2066019 RepID=UPI002F926665